MHHAAAALRRELIARTPSLRWDYTGAYRADPFPPHVRLDGTKAESWDDPVLTANGFPGGHYYPGDHDGCLCDYHVVLDRTSKSATAWTVRYDQTGDRVSAHFENRRYKPEALRLPPARQRPASRGHVSVTRHRLQPPDPALFFYRDVLSARRWHSEISAAFAVAR